MIIEIIQFALQVFIAMSFFWLTWFNSKLMRFNDDLISNNHKNIAINIELRHQIKLLQDNAFSDRARIGVLENKLESKS